MNDLMRFKMRLVSLVLVWLPLPVFGASSIPCVWLDLNAQIAQKRSVGDRLSLRCQAPKEAMNSFHLEDTITYLDSTSVKPIHKKEADAHKKAGVILDSLSLADEDILVFEFIVFSPGAHQVPGMKLGSAKTRLVTEPFSFEAETLADDKTEAPMVMPLVSLTYTGQSHSWMSPFWFFVILGALSALAVLAFFARKWFRTKALSPYEEAIQKFQDIQTLVSPQKHKITLLSNIIRQYLQDEFGLKVTAKTTSELPEILSSHPLIAPEAAKLTAIFYKIDPVRFGGELISEQEWAECLSTAQTSIRAIHEHNLLESMAKGDKK